MSPLRIVAYGEPAGELWGAALDDSGLVLAVSGRGVAAETGEGRLGVQDGEWRLEAEGVQLRVEPAPGQGEADAAPAGEEQPPAPGELCRARGQVTLSGRTFEVDCPAVRVQVPDIELASLDSARAVYGWFGPGRALALLALRPPGGSGHESDRLTAFLFEPEGVTPVVDPRLSTTYGSDGVPARAGLELWVREGEEEFPRRAAAEALAPPAQAKAGELVLLAVPLTCHGRDGDGRGLYLLARRR